MPTVTTDKGHPSASYSLQSFSLRHLQCCLGFRSFHVSSKWQKWLSRHSTSHKCQSGWNCKSLTVGRSRKCLLEHIQLSWKHLWHHFSPHTMHLKHGNPCLAQLYFACITHITQLSSTLNHGKFNQIQINLHNMQSTIQLIQITIYQWQSVINLRVSISYYNTNASNFNLSELHKELLQQHYCLGHIGLRTAQFIMPTGTLAASHAIQFLHNQVANIPSCELLKWTACQFG